MAAKSPLSASPVYCFGVFQVNLAARELSKHGVRYILKQAKAECAKLL
jgi:hypothetical protein